jgi:hypothetical protein
MGTIEPKEGGHIHGVLHTMTKADMDNLDKMEGGPCFLSFIHTKAVRT